LEDGGVSEDDGVPRGRDGEPRTAEAPVSVFRFRTVYALRKLGFPTKFHPVHKEIVVAAGTIPPPRTSPRR